MRFKMKFQRAQIYIFFGNIYYYKLLNKIIQNSDFFSRTCIKMFTDGHIIFSTQPSEIAQTLIINKCSLSENFNQKTTIFISHHPGTLTLS